jgi:sec-independent protein translocase protein TatA
MGIGMRELIIILLVVLVVFGTKKLRTIGSDLGSAVRGFKKSMGEGEEEGDAAAKQLKASVNDPDAEFPETKTSSEASKNNSNRAA